MLAIDTKGTTVVWTGQLNLWNGEGGGWGSSSRPGASLTDFATASYEALFERQL